MKRLILFCTAGLFVFFLNSCSGDKSTYASIETPQGTMVVRLFNTTPQHRDNFIRLAQEGFYDSLMFHRVINGFMIQGGDPQSKFAGPQDQLGFGGPGYTVPAEIVGPKHFKGALAAARDMNPEKRSSGSQFYIVHGNTVNDSTLDNLELQKGITYTKEERDLYKKIGGAPFLDNDYTVFGEVVEGMEVIDAIARVPKGRADRPLTDVRMKVSIVK
ncbi:MAG: peptidylprolyl isomerase [Saprospiraceae bacterium]|jgi:cyclophilin family peptidyl-prolyl cis-trans isomerase|nr:peptidylprolyl isomerase [Saprospiraceae bacterium]MDP4820550.1 peptidylprolyl isomerase [Saprospiraceae bacterium]MDP4997330.1 peptidylprolyl isomerase [Saprospiraceae bacterium]